MTPLIRRACVILLVLAGCASWLDLSLRLSATEASLHAVVRYLDETVGTRTLPDGSVAPMNRADGLAKLLADSLVHAAK